MKVKQEKISKNALLKLRDLRSYPFMNLSILDMPNEVWKAIPNFDECYFVSNYGRVKSLPRLLFRGTKPYYTKERMIPQYASGTLNKHTGTYKHFSLSIRINYEGSNYGFVMRRLLYKLFIADIDFKVDKLSIVHKDGDSLNNIVENLTATNRTDIFYKQIKTNARPRKPKKQDTYYNQVAVIQYDTKGNIIHRYNSVTEAAIAFGAKVCDLKKVLTKQHKLRNGFVLRYETDSYNGEYSDFTKFRKVKQFLPDGTLVKSFDSISQAASETGIDTRLISKNASKKLKTANGFVWRKDGDSYNGENNKVDNRKAVCQYQKSGKLLKRFESIAQAAKATNNTVPAISACVSGANKSSKGFIWRYENEPYLGEMKNLQKGIPVTQLDLNGKFIATFITISSATKSTGINDKSITKNVRGSSKSAHGFIFRKATPSEISRIPQYIHTSGSKLSQSIEICQYTRAGEKLATFSSIAEAYKITGVSNSVISRFINDPTHANGKFIWRRKDDIYLGELIEKRAISESKPVTQYDLEGNKLKVYISCREAHRALKIIKSSISEAARGNLKTAHGFIWRLGDGPDKIDIVKHLLNPVLVDKRKSVSCYDMNGNKLGFYKSLVEAAKVNNISYISVSGAANGLRKSAGEKLWILGDAPDKIDPVPFLFNREIKAIP